MSTTDVELETGGRERPLKEITRAVVGIYRQQLGRGPTHAQAHFAGPNSIVCLLEGTLTPVERTLTGIGRVEELQRIRLLFQRSAAPEMRAAVERASGRRVTAFMSGYDPESDVASEVFTLEPLDG